MVLQAKKWDKLVEFISHQFGSGEKLDLQAILFLIGVNELGQGYRDFTKHEKLDLLHIAICRILSDYGYFSFVRRDKDGWPHWKSNEEGSNLNSEDQTVLLKEGIVKYFDDAKIKFI